MSTIVWSKDECFYCHMAKHLLEISGVEYEERNIQSGDWTRDQMLEAVPDAKTVPQIFMDGEYVGGFTELQKYMKEGMT